MNTFDEEANRMNLFHQEIKNYSPKTMKVSK